MGGRPTGARTLDKRIKSPLLYQLSYRPDTRSRENSRGRMHNTGANGFKSFRKKNRENQTPVVS